MGVYLKNKTSTVNYVVSSGILQFLLMGVLSLWLIFPNLLESLGSQDIGLVELRADVGDEDIDEVLILLNQEEWIDKLSIKHISKDEAISIMANEIDDAMIERVKGENPFRDVITFASKNDKNLAKNFLSLRAKSELEDAIAGIYNLADTPIQQSSIVTSLSMMFSIPLALLIAILGFLFLKSSVNSLFDKNQQMISSLLTYGTEPGFLRGIFRKQVIKDTLVGWLIGFVLFILTFYLIIGALNIGISHISMKMMVLTVLLPLFLMLIFIYISINKKVSDLS